VASCGRVVVFQEQILYFEAVKSQITAIMKLTRQMIYDLFNSARWTDSAILFLRVFAGGMLLWHGVMKIQNFDYIADSFPSVLWMTSATSLTMATLVEVGCSLLIIVGVLTRLALIPLIFTMFIASFFGHQGGAFGELSFIYMGIFISMFIAGPGLYSLDRLWFAPENKKRIARGEKSTQNGEL
jgi:putative oxidoreductase